VKDSPIETSNVRYPIATAAGPTTTAAHCIADSDAHDRDLVDITPQHRGNFMVKKILIGLTLLPLFCQPTFAESPPQTPHQEQFRTWIQEMKKAPRGPFARIRWFCNDGSVLPPESYACVEHDGGHQHGEWSEKTRELRDAGYYIANFLADLDPAAFLALPDYETRYKHFLMEQFLEAQDEGWIFRKARYYRGAFQEEDERRGARALLQALSGEPEWNQRRFVLLRMGAQLLPHGADTATVQNIRQVSAALSDRDPAFASLRNRIHGRLAKEHAAQVREYAAKLADPALAEEYESLAQEIDQVFHRRPLREQLQNYARQLPATNSKFKRLIQRAAAQLEQEDSAEARHRITAQLLTDVRNALPDLKSPALRLDTLDLSLSLENEHFVAATQLRAGLPHASRQQRLTWLRNSVDALYGTGIIGRRQRDALRTSFQRLRGDSVSLASYKRELDYLGRLPGWGEQDLRFYFQEPMEKFGEIEPLAHLFTQDRLRGSPLLFYSAILDTLLKDANHLAGIRHRLFGEEIGAGLHALNPGLSRGILHTSTQHDAVSGFASNGIYLLPETVSDLPPVAGILTQGEGNPLSHVQLLARNLGIPNVAVDDSLLPKLTPHNGERVVFAVSPAGTVWLAADKGQYDAIFGQEQSAGNAIIRPDLKKLDLTQRDFVPLSSLRASDSGRIVGPKAAKLGELKHHFPEAVVEGLAIPFGAFRQLLDQPMAGENQSVFDWMVSEYAAIRRLPPDSDTRNQATERFRQRLQNWILTADPGKAFRTRLAAAMERTFGKDGSYGVFVRSDTNVEDLPGFTGAGLNLTVPNEVGFQNVMAAISRVWASPFSARAFAWRQSHMEQPQHVYPAILLLHSVPSDKSGVLVTQDIDTGDRNWLSVAVNEGVGGAVDGQAAESLRINTQTGEVRMLAQATAPYRREPAPEGGIAKLPVSGSETVLQPAEIAQLIKLSKELPKRFPAIVDDRGRPVPADIEFGFVNGQLRLFQLRPFLESKRAQGSAFLSQMDQNLKDARDIKVSLLAIPEVPASAKAGG
jgi:hypothetical protein